jgi:hypothetical protein
MFPYEHMYVAIPVCRKWRQRQDPSTKVPEMCTFWHAHAGPSSTFTTLIRHDTYLTSVVNLHSNYHRHTGRACYCPAAPPPRTRGNVTFFIPHFFSRSFPVYLPVFLLPFTLFIPSSIHFSLWLLLLHSFVLSLFLSFSWRGGGG